MSTVSDEFALSYAQTAEIQSLLDSHQYAAAYRKVADWAEGGEGVPQASIIWLRGAADLMKFSMFTRSSR